MDIGFALRSTIFCFIFLLDWCFALRIMSNVKNTKQVKKFIRFFVLLPPYLTNLFCCIYLFDACFTLRSILYFFYFWFRVMFCSQNHEHRQEHKKGKNFSVIFRSFTIFNFFSLLYLFVRWMFCSQIYFSLYWCFALIFMSIVKNIKKVNKFMIFSILLPYLFFLQNFSCSPRSEYFEFFFMFVCL